MKSNQQIDALFFDMDNTLFDLVGAQMAACAGGHAVTGNDWKKICSTRIFSGLFMDLNPMRISLISCTIAGYPCQESYDSARRIYEQEKIRAITPYPGLSIP